jgi:uncharacterized membrane protein HdeD (DUF308 family)
MPIALPADADDLRKHSTWFIVYGVIMALLGVFAIVAPGVATLAVTLMVGWLLLFGGAFGLFAVISGGTSAPGFWWNLLTTIVYILAGLAVLTRPIAGVLTLTIILAAYLLAGGVFRIMMAAGYRSHAPGAWFWLLLSGIIDIVLAFIIMTGLPETAAWVIGLLVGINLLMMGFAIVMVALSVRSSAAQVLNVGLGVPDAAARSDALLIRDARRAHSPAKRSLRVHIERID